MDGLSAAASVIGVISLAMQLGQTTRKLIGFLDTIADAPGEVIRLNDLLKLIFAVSAGVVNALEHQRRHQGDGAAGREHICEVLIVCLRKLTSIQDIVDRSERLQSGASRTTRGWTRLKFALKKDEILELERQLGQALSVLNVLLTTSIMYNNVSRVAASPSPIIGSLSSFPPDVDSQQPECHSGTDLELDLETKRAEDSSERPKMNTSLSQLYLCLGGPFSLRCERRTRRQLTRDLNTEETRNEVKKETVGISLRVLSTSIHLVVSRLSSCSPSLGLRVRHVVSGNTWRLEILDIIRNDDVDSFRKLISQGICTLDSCVEDGVTMLESAEMLGAIKVATYLQAQGCELCTTSAWFTFSNLGGVRKSCLPQSRFRSISPKLDLVEYDPDDIIPRRRSSWLDGSLVLEALQWLASTGSLETTLPLSDYFGSLLCIVCVWWGILEADGSREQLNLLVTRIICRGGDVHHLDRLGRTPLQSLLRYMRPEDDSSIITRWLTLLGDSQVDLRKYLEEECRICPNPFDTFLQDCFQASSVFASCRPRIISMSILEDNQINQIDPRMMWVNPASNAVELLQEFRLLPEVCVIPGISCKYMRYWFDLWKTDSDSVLAGGKTIRELLDQWVAERAAIPDMDHVEDLSLLRPDEVQSAIEAGELDLDTLARMLDYHDLCACDFTGQYLQLWPFNGNAHTLCQSGNMIGRACLDGSTWCEVHCCHFNHERFERKQRKKWMKRIGIKTIKTPRLPGGWVE